MPDSVVSAGKASTAASTIFYKEVIHFFYNQPRELLECAGEALVRLRKSHLVWDLAPASSFAEMGWLFLGRLEAIRALYDETEPVATRTGHLGALGFGKRTMAFAELFASGHLGDFEAFARSDLESVQRAHPPGVLDSHVYVGIARFWRGDWEEAGAHFDEAATRDPFALYSGSGISSVFLLKSHRGDGDALEYLDRWRQTLPRPAEPNAFRRWKLREAGVTLA